MQIISPLLIEAYPNRIINIHHSFLPAFAGAILIGFLGFTLIKHGAIKVDDPEKIMPALANFLLPSWLAGILISGAIAAMMSYSSAGALIIS